MDLSDIAYLRLARQGLTAPRFESAAAVVGWLGAVQAQEYDVARWSLGQRSMAETDASIEQALADGRILRTHLLRPTWHFVLPADIRWLVELTAPRILRAMAYYDRQLELNGAIVAHSNRLIVDALEQTSSLTRIELAKVLATGGVEASGQRLGHLMFHAELACLVCSGPRKGKQQTYALLERRAPAATSLAADEAMAELTRRFFTSHGPATAKDFAVWASLTLTESRRGLDMLGREVETIEANGRTYWLLGDTPPPTEDAPRALVLQGYDEYIMGYNETKDVLGAGERGWMAPGRPPMTHALMIDGQLVGHWRRVQSPKAISIDLQLYRALEAWEHNVVEAAAERYGAFVGLPATIGAVEVPEG